MDKEKLTKKQKDFIRYYLETGNGVKAALKAYNTNDYMTAHAIASENLQKPTIKRFINEAMSQYGFDDSYLFNLHRRLLEHDNSAVVARALDMAYRIKGYYIQGKLVASNQSRDLRAKGYFRIEDFIQEIGDKSDT